jgi:hypothetical protein
MCVCVCVHVDHGYVPRLKPVFQLVLAGYTAVEHNVVEYNTSWLDTLSLHSAVMPKYSIV